MVIHYASDDARINGMRPGYEAALKANNATFEMHTYPETRHAFHTTRPPVTTKQPQNWPGSARSRFSRNICRNRPIIDPTT
jgi:dienelactone hydrolase